MAEEFGLQAFRLGDDTGPLHAPDAELLDAGVQPILISGGGLEALVSTRGVHRLRGPEGERPVEIEIEGTPACSTFRAGAGSWVREFSLGTEGTLVEEGFPADGVPALVLRWRTMRAGAAMGPDAGPRVRVRIAGGGVDVRTPATVVVAPAGEDPERLRRYFGPLRARLLQRANRLRDDAPLRVVWTGSDGRALRGVEDARRQLDAALPDPAAPRLAAASAGAPATPAIHAEVGLAQLLLGWHDAARRQLRHLAVVDHPHGLLHLAARWTQWTGRTQELLEHEAALRTAAATLKPGAVPPGGAAWPTAARLVHDLADAVERTGRTEWHKALLTRSALLSPSSSPVVLPAVAAFGSRALDTAASARLVRSWIEGRLGAEADAGWGRLTLRPTLGQDRPGETPDPPPLGLFEIRNLRVGDARVDLDCRRDGERFTLRVAQTRGRTPLNVVFEPWLPASEIGAVTLGGEPADPERVPERGGVRVRLQFPLDPERRLVIDVES